ncbi:MAG: hypothetical protein KY463_07085 [Actinobacteria bacterium]|nr:hypothetical protein [Actinomycetota bacterium]
MSGEGGPLGFDPEPGQDDAREREPAVAQAQPEAPRATGLPPGQPLPPFAVVLARSDVVCDDEDDPCDANVAASGARVEGDARRRAACDVRGPTVLNVCELIERGPLVLGLAASRGASCLDPWDRLERLARRHRGLQVALVAIGGGLEELRTSVRRHGWSFPVGWDRDGILASIYGVAACPYVTVARWRGRVQGTLVGSAAASGGELDRLTGAAVAASRRAGWRP